MGRLIVDQTVSADGFAADRGGDLDFVRQGGDFSATEPEQLRMLDGASAILLGANTYRIFADYWPSADPSVQRAAVPMNTLPKHVVSSTLRDAPWGDLAPAIVESGDVTVVVERLRDRYDGDIVVWGSLTLTDALFRAGVVDVLRLRVVPVLLGSGRPVAPETIPVTSLRLEGSNAYPSGHLVLSYALAFSGRA